MKKYAMALFAAMFCFATSFAADSIGFVNFKNCIEKSKQGKEEKNAFESMKKQMNDTLEKADRELNDLAKKLEDQDYMDGLSPAAEEELKGRFQNLSQEFSRYQNQYYQLLNQANYKMLQLMHDEVAKSAEKIREGNKLAFIISEDSAFAYASSLDFTEQVIKEMDKRFDLQNAETAAKD